MRTTFWHLALGASFLCLSSSRAWSAAPLEPPKNVNVEPSTPRSAQLASRAASAEIAGDPQAALQLAEKAVAANPRDPWGYYAKGDALASLGKVDDAVKALGLAEEHFALSDLWGRSVAIYGRAQALAEVNRCAEARGEFLRYAAFVRERDPQSADIAIRVAADCRVWGETSPTQPPPVR
jgi:tetratricopeptide (TPR) repeat protein